MLTATRRPRRCPASHARNSGAAGLRRRLLHRPGARKRDPGVGNLLVKSVSGRRGRRPLLKDRRDRWAWSETPRNRTPSLARLHTALGSRGTLATLRQWEKL